MSPNYQNAKIYKIYSYENDEVYYGSTCETLSQRMARHRRVFKSYKKGKGNYITSFDILELTSAKIELVENFPCNSKEELLQREGYYIKNNNCVNKHIPSRTKKEYYEDNKEQIKEYYEEYRQQNKDKINENKKEYRKSNINTYNHYQKEYMREYRKQKKEQLLMYNEDIKV